MRQEPGTHSIAERLSRRVMARHHLLMSEGSAIRVDLSPIRVGLIGFGFVSKTFHVPLIRATDGYKITAVSSSKPADVSAMLSDVDVVSDPKELATRPDIDLVVIASPNETHALLAELAMCAGRNVVVNKPFTITVEEARHLASVAEDKNVLLSVFQNRR